MEVMRIIIPYSFSALLGPVIAKHSFASFGINDKSGATDHDQPRY